MTSDNGHDCKPGNRCSDMIGILAVNKWWKWLIGTGAFSLIIASIAGTILQFISNSTLSAMKSENTILASKMDNVLEELKEIKRHDKIQDYYIELNNVRDNEVRRKNGMKKIPEKIIEFPSMEDF